VSAECCISQKLGGKASYKFLGLGILISFINDYGITVLILHEGINYIINEDLSCTNRN